MKTIQEQIAVMQHFAAGGKVECKNHVGENWFQIDCPSWDWMEHVYRIAEEEADPYAELKAAAADPTKQIRCRDVMGFSEWRDAGVYWHWNCQPCNYEIRDKPKPFRKVKLVAWWTEDSIAWLIEGKQPIPYWNWKRVPAEDKEIEVEDE